MNANMRPCKRPRLSFATVFPLVLFALNAAGQTPVARPEPVVPAQLSGDEVVQRMVRRNLERANALHAFRGTRVYHLTYQGFPVNKEAEMVTSVVYRAPDSKQFTIMSQSGSQLIVDKVFRKLLESEQEAMKAENRARNALNTDNYTFVLTGYESAGADANYVFQVQPKTPSKFLYRGKIWVDAKDFAVSRMEVEPAKSPSFWTKKSDIRHTYAKVDGFWLPKQNRSVSTIRLGGQAVLTIDYKDYKIVDPLAPPPGSEVTRLAPATH
jgi:hypothetical protein